jgi:hypothetical protein
MPEQGGLPLAINYLIWSLCDLALIEKKNKLKKRG